MIRHTALQVANVLIQCVFDSLCLEPRVDRELGPLQFWQVLVGPHAYACMPKEHGAQIQGPYIVLRDGRSCVCERLPREQERVLG